MEMYSEDDGKINLELKSEAVCPIVIEPALPADGLAENSENATTVRRSKRTAKKRSLLQPGELDNNVAARMSKYCRMLPLPEPAGDKVEADDDDSDFIISQVYEVKPEDLPVPRKKRTYRRRKTREPVTEKSPPSSESVDKLLGQLVSAYCGDEGHPANCEDCKSRIKVIQALLQSSGKCHQETSTSDEPAANPTVSADSEEPDKTEMAGVALFCCAKCPDRFDTYDEFQHHEKMHSAGKKKCNICHRYLSSHSSMTVHLRTHSGEKPFHCKDCGATFAAAKTLNEHRVKHSGDRPYQCTHCSRSFARKSILKVHLATHTAHLPHICSACGKGFALASILRQHEKVVHSGQPVVRARYKRKQVGSDETMACPDCGKVLSGRSSMKAHQFLHTGARPYVCAICSRTFKRYQHLVDHGVRHTGSRAHVCEQCGARFSRSSSLKVHGRLHTGETPYSCEICGVTFAQASNLRQHTRSHHTREKPFACSFCGERFMWAKDRALHEKRRHTHDRPFLCELCDRRLLTKYELRLHKQSRHPDDKTPPAKRRLHSCAHCSASFTKKCSLNRHLQSHLNHSGTEEDLPAIATEQPMCGNTVPSGHDRHANPKKQKSCPGAKKQPQSSPGVDKSQHNPRVDRVQHRPRVDKSAESAQPRRHYCPHCQLSFPTLATLSRHVRTHFRISDSEGEEELADEEQIDDGQSSTDGEQLS